MSPEPALSLAEARIRLEGRVELIEAATAQWEALRVGLRGGTMRGAPTPSSVSEQREALSALARYPACRPIVERFTRTQQATVEAVEKRLAELGLENKGPISLRDELERHLPVSAYTRWRLIGPSLTPRVGAVARVLWWAITAALLWALSAFFNEHITEITFAFAVILVVASVGDQTLLKPQQLLVTQKAVLTDKFAYFSDIMSVTAIRVPRPFSREQTQLSFELRDGTKWCWSHRPAPRRSSRRCDATASSVTNFRRPVEGTRCQTHCLALKQACSEQ